MLGQAFRKIGFICLLLPSHVASATTVTLNIDAARAVLIALKNPSLTHDEALKIAEMPGNKGIIRKENEFRIPVTNETFASALMAAARGRKVTDPTEIALYFDTVKPKVEQLLALTKQIETNPQSFQESIEKRIELFTPPGSKIQLQGYVLAGGDGGGYAFGSTDFYLNIGFMDDAVLAKVTTTHELYHAVQGAFANQREPSVEPTAKRRSPAQLACEDTRQLFANLYEEGSATYVEDFSTLPQSHSEIAVRQVADLNDGLAHLDASVTLLELSVVGLSAADPTPYDDVYEVGFLGHGVLYSIGYAMAKAIVENDGPQGLAAFLKLPSYKFLLRYTQLPKYGTDKDHPKLGPNTVRAINQMANGCG